MKKPKQGKWSEQTMQANINVLTNMDCVDKYAVMSNEELDKANELARARFVYASEQESYWQNERYCRVREFNKTLIAMAKRKHGFTEEQIRDNPQVSTATWTYAK